METKDYPKLELPPKEYWEDEEWLNENGTELSHQYPNTWIAIVNKRVVASGYNLAKVISKAKKMTGKEHILTHFAERGVHVY